MVRIIFSGILKSVRMVANIINTPTPMPTAIISIQLFIPDTCSASTIKSGSAIVITTPIKKPTSNISQTLCVLLKKLPIFCPIGSIAVSAPSVKHDIPKISNTTAIKNCTIICHDIGTKQSASRSTIHIMGSTEIADSFSFDKYAFIVPPTFLDSVFETIFTAKVQISL